MVVGQGCGKVIPPSSLAPHYPWNEPIRPPYRTPVLTPRPRAAQTEMAVSAQQIMR